MSLAVARIVVEGGPAGISRLLYGGRLTLAPRPLVFAAFAPARSRCEDLGPGRSSRHGLLAAEAARGAPTLTRAATILGGCAPMPYPGARSLGPRAAQPIVLDGRTSVRRSKRRPFPWHRPKPARSWAAPSTLREISVADAVAELPLAEKHRTLFDSRTSRAASWNLRKRPRSPRANTRIWVARPPRPSRTAPPPCSLRPCPSRPCSAARRSTNDNSTDRPSSSLTTSTTARAARESSTTSPALPHFLAGRASRHPARGAVLRAV